MSSDERTRRLTLAELRPIVEFYNVTVPTWRVARKDTLIREAGPVLQGITFERLSGGEYRPTGHVRVLVAPRDFWAMELDQVLNVKVRQINPRQDREYRDRVVDAIRAEFVPNVDRPLVAEDVLSLLEREALPTSGEAYSLAALNAYLGHDERALYWCSRFAEMLKASGRELQPFDHKQQAFLASLEGWIRAGDAKQQLEEVLQEERRKWGIA